MYFISPTLSPFATSLTLIPHTTPVRWAFPKTISPMSTALISLYLYLFNGMDLSNDATYWSNSFLCNDFKYFSIADRFRPVFCPVNLIFSIFCFKARLLKLICHLYTDVRHIANLSYEIAIVVCLFVCLYVCPLSK